MSNVGGVPGSPPKPSLVTPAGQSPELLQVASLPELTGMLTPGQVVNANVLMLYRDRALLELLGKQVMAETRLPLTAGDQLQVRVKGVAEDKVLLQLVARGAQTGQKETIDNILTRLLTTLGLKAQEGTLTAARNLLEAGLPLTEAGIKEMEQLLTSLGSDRPALDAFAFLKSNDLPVTLEIIRSLRTAFSGPQALAAALEGLESALANPETANTPAAQRLRELLESLPLRGENAEILRNELTRFFKDLLTSSEHKLLLAREGAPVQKDLRMNLLNLLAGMEKEAPVPAGEKAPGDGTGPKNPLAQRVEQFVRSWEGEQIRNTATRVDTPPHLVIPVPLKFNDRTLWGQLAIYRRDKGKSEKWDPKHIRIAFFLDTPNLGSLHIDVETQYRKIRCNVVAKEGETASFLEERKDTLKARFQDLNYETQSIRCTVGTPSREKPVQAKVNLEKLGFDIRV